MGQTEELLKPLGTSYTDTYTHMHILVFFSYWYGVYSQSPHRGGYAKPPIQEGHHKDHRCIIIHTNKYICTFWSFSYRYVGSSTKHQWTLWNSSSTGASWCPAHIINVHHHLCIVILDTWFMPVNSYVAYMLECFPHWYISGNLAFGIYVAFEGHIGGWDIFSSRIVNKCCILLIFMDMCYTVGSIYRLHEKYSGTYMCNVAGRFVCGAYANNVNCMYTSASGHIFDCSEFIWGIEHSCDMCAWSNLLMWHLRRIFVAGTYMIVTCELDVAVACVLAQI